MGLADETKAARVEKAIGTDPGVTQIETVCHKTGKAIVIFDPAKTNRDKIATVIETAIVKVLP